VYIEVELTMDLVSVAYYIDNRYLYLMANKGIWWEILICLVMSYRLQKFTNSMII